MLNVAVRALVLVALLAPPHAAGLKYSVHSDVMQTGSAQDPMSQVIASQIAAAFPAGGIDQVILASEKGTRSEQKQAASGMPAGVVTITHPDGTMVSMDPTAKTWWKQSSAAEAAAQMQQLGIKMDVQTKKTGEFDTISGMKAEKVTMNLSMNVPGVDASMLPSFSLEFWMTDAVKSPVTSVMSSAMLAKLGVGDTTQMKDLNDGRFALKQVINLPGNQITAIVKDVSKQDVEDALFDVPKDFKEVAGPGGLLTPLLRPVR